MPSLFSTGLSGLLAFRRAIDTTGHNIANVNTPGYTRQRTELSTREAQPYGNGWIGNGVNVTSVQRIYDEYVGAQVRTSSSALERLNTYASHTERLNNMFADTSTGLTASLQKFVNAFQGVANAPTSIPARQVLLSEAHALAERLASYETRLSAMDNEFNQRLTGEVADINALAQGIARLNNDIWMSYARTGGQPPNDLLDQRDRLLDELSSKVSINVVKQDGYITNVFIGSGQPLVLSGEVTELVAQPDPYDSTRLNIAARAQSGTIDVTAAITGGSLGGLLDFRREQLDPAHNALGRISAALADVVNQQHHAGLDLEGNLGGDFFSVGSPQVLDNIGNQGTGTVIVTRTDIGALTDRDYILENGADGWTLRDALTGVATPMTGTGDANDPFVAEGLSIVVEGAHQTGDSFMLRPTRGVVSGFNVLVDRPEAVGAASPIRTLASTSNTGNGTISDGTVIDAANAQLLDPVTITFTSATTYQINGAGSFTYTPGEDIDVNGWRVQISGNPAAGDEFIVRSNVGGVGDNRNALALANALTSPVLDGGRASLSDAVGRFVGGIGVATRHAQVNRDAQQLVYEESLAARDSVSGVNLDEEAADLIRLQQAYQAAAQVIRVADTLFQTLFDATRR
jgi:flagellar hook-associated protein 1 FlgK